MALEGLQNGRYRRLRLLGSGGMGEVYLMEDTRVSRQVAIKVIRSESAPYPDNSTAKDAARLFQREAKSIAALDHPNILPLYDFGEETSDSVIFTYMVMPFCPEGSLDTWLRQRSSAGMLSLQDISHLVQQIADALQYAHDHHIIHLDVKPSNFLIRSNPKNPNRPTLLLADFGIARTNIATVASSSRTIRGTPTSMAPEQWGSTPVLASDQYSLAIMAYELLTGRTPFKGGMEQLMYQHFYTEPPPPSTFNKQLSPAIDAVILRALAKKPADRFPSISALADAFDQAVRTSPSPSVVAPPSISNVHATLAISQTEARSGTNRSITLPEGQRVNVTIPPGTYDGQVIRLHNLVEASNSVDVVMLTIAIKQTEAPPLQPMVMSTEATILTPYPNQQSSSHPDHNLPTLAVSNPGIRISQQPPLSPQPPQPAPTQKPPSRSRSVRVVTSLIILLLVIIAGVGGFFLYSGHPTGTTLASSQTATASAQTLPTQAATVTSTPTPQNGLYIAGTYNGSMTDQTTGQTSHISVNIVQTQGFAPLSGTLTFTSPSQNTYPLNGTIDTQGNFSFTVQTSTAQAPLYFYGAVYQTDYLKGNFCNTSTNSCSPNTGGYFLVGPRF